MVLSVILVVFFCLFFIPISLDINVNVKSNEFLLDIGKMNGFKNNISIKLFSLIPVYRKKLFENTKRKKKKDNKFFKKFNKKNVIVKILNKAYIEKFSLSLGFNLNDDIANSYVNASINSIICLLINFNSKKFNFKNLYYSTYISDNNLKINFECIIKLSIANTIRVLVTEYVKIQKQKLKVSIFAYKERRIYGKSSN